jgi:transcriptional antiterminator NusG
MTESPENPMDADARDDAVSSPPHPSEEPSETTPAPQEETVPGSAPVAEGEPVDLEPDEEPAETQGPGALEDRVAQAVADAAVQEAIADAAIAQALEEAIGEDIEAAKVVEEASDAAIQGTYEERVAQAVAAGLEDEELADVVAQAAADADVQEAIADGAIARALEETITEDIEAARAVEEASDAAIVQGLEERVEDLVVEAATADTSAEEPEPVLAAEPEAAEELETAVPDPFKGPGEWYVVHTYAGYENKVRANLESRIHTMQMEDKIFDVHIPMEDVMEIKGGKKQVVQRKVFPGYLLVKMVYDNDSWYVVRNTPGVTGFVAAGTGSKPTPLSRREVEKILAVKKEEVKPAFRLGFEEKDVVRIISGPFADFNGTISEINVDQSKLKVLVNIFDRETPVELGFDQVVKV